MEVSAGRLKGGRGDQRHRRHRSAADARPLTLRPKPINACAAHKSWERVGRSMLSACHVLMQRLARCSIIVREACIFSSMLSTTA
jgi:hypothetical protein